MSNNKQQIVIERSRFATFYSVTGEVFQEATLNKDAKPEEVAEFFDLHNHVESGATYEDGENFERSKFGAELKDWSWLTMGRTV